MGNNVEKKKKKKLVLVEKKESNLCVISSDKETITAFWLRWLGYLWNKVSKELTHDFSLLPFFSDKNFWLRVWHNLFTHV